MSAAKGSGLEWFVRRGAVVRGPFSSTRVRHFVLEGRLGLDDQVSADKSDWRRLGSVPEVVPLQMRVEDACLSAEQDAQRKDERRKALWTIGVVVLLVIVLIVGVSMTGSDKQETVRDCSIAPAPGVFLEGCQLSGAQMTGAVLREAHMANVILTGSQLGQADLAGADLRYADLGGADLSYAKLNSAMLMGASLRQADLTNADLSAADLSFADLSGARIGGARVTGASFNGAIWTDGRHCAATDCPR